MMRHFYSFSLLFLLIANTIGGICILCIHHHRITEHIESIIRTGVHAVPLEEIIIPVSESAALTWLKDHLEFSYKGHMYDVVCTDFKNDTTIYHCINDKKEEGLIREIANNDNHPFPGQHQDSCVVLQFFKIISEIVLTPSAVYDYVPGKHVKNMFACQLTYFPVCLTPSCEPPDIS